MTYMNGRHYGPKHRGSVKRDMGDPVERIYGGEMSRLPSTEREIDNAFGTCSQEGSTEDRPLMIGD